MVPDFPVVYTFFGTRRQEAYGACELQIKTNPGTYPVLQDGTSKQRQYLPRGYAWI